jgi:hypothetical protein
MACPTLVNATGSCVGLITLEHDLRPLQKIPAVCLGGRLVINEKKILSVVQLPLDTKCVYRTICDTLDALRLFVPGGFFFEGKGYRCT